MNARERIKQVLLDEFEGTEFFLVDVKQSATKYQVFIDSDDKLSIDKCAKTSRMLEAMLEEENLVPEQYTLEVSSPGMTNALKHVRQYKKRIGDELDVWTHENQHYRGTLLQVTEDEKGIILEKEIKEKKKVIGKEEVNLALADIKKAILIFKF